MMRQKLEEVFEDEQRSLLKIDDDQRLDVNVTLADIAHEKNAGIVFLCVKEPYFKIQNQLHERQIPESHVRYVDGITKLIVNKEVPQDDKVTYVQRTKNLQNISIAVSLAADIGNTKNVVLVVDSLLSLFTTHNQNQVLAFFENLRERMDTLHLNLVLFDEGRALEDKIGEQLYATVDNTIFLRENN